MRELNSQSPLLKSIYIGKVLREHSDCTDCDCGVATYRQVFLTEF
jgi:hypothetical protein